MVKLVALEMDMRFIRKRPKLIDIGASKIWADPSSFTSRIPLYANPPDYNDMMAWNRHLKSGDLFVDVGAYVGLYTLWAAERGADVIAIEPNDGARERLREHLEMNGYKATIIPAVAGARSGELVTITADEQAGNHLVPNERGNTRTVTIDEIIGDRLVAGMKIDVEGVERLVLEGARKCLADRRIRLIQIEWNALSRDILGEGREPIAELLRDHEYELFYPDEEGRLEQVMDPASHPGCPDVFAAPTT